LEFAEESRIEKLDVSYKLSDDFSHATINVAVAGDCYKDGMRVQITVKRPNGSVVATRVLDSLSLREKKFQAMQTIELSDVELWWPVNYGDQPLYTIVAETLNANGVVDASIKRTGFRDIRISDNFDIRVNGKPLRLWGGNVAQLRSLTHCWDAERSTRLLELARKGNLNVLRIWGGGNVFKDDFYEKADEIGMLLWQEFFHDHSMYPDGDEFLSEYTQECEYHIGRLKHHPSILLWCGGNESYMKVYDHDNSLKKREDVDFIGEKIFDSLYREIAKRLDPQRYYHPNSPHGGDFPNSVTSGDTHAPGWDPVYYIRDIGNLPVLVSEFAVNVNPRPSWVLKKWLGGSIWPSEGYNTLWMPNKKDVVPSTWKKLIVRPFGNDIRNDEKFYDAASPEMLLYRLGAAGEWFVRSLVEKSRRGKVNRGSRNVSKGTIIWKFNESWPFMGHGIVDYELEPNSVYYHLKRAYQPLLLSFEKDNSIRLWLTNDTIKDLDCTVSFRLHDPLKSETVYEKVVSASIKANSSDMVCELEQLRYVPRNFILFSALHSDKGDLLTTCYDYLDIERRLCFPADCRIDLEAKGNGTLIVSVDKYARCVEIRGNEDGDEFGWFFDDNYFDLLPGIRKEIKISGPHRKGQVRASALNAPLTKPLSIS
jgi:beta-galactosidase/beta-glucuronidase